MNKGTIIKADYIAQEINSNYIKIGKCTIEYEDDYHYIFKIKSDDIEYAFQINKLQLEVFSIQEIIRFIISQYRICILEQYLQ